MGAEYFLRLCPAHGYFFPDSLGADGAARKEKAPQTQSGQGRSPQQLPGTARPQSRFSAESRKWHGRVKSRPKWARGARVSSADGGTRNRNRELLCSYS